MAQVALNYFVLLISFHSISLPHFPVLNVSLDLGLLSYKLLQVVVMLISKVFVIYYTHLACWAVFIMVHSSLVVTSFYILSACV